MHRRAAPIYYTICRDADIYGLPRFLADADKNRRQLPERLCRAASSQAAYFVAEARRCYAGSIADATFTGRIASSACARVIHFNASPHDCIHFYDMLIDGVINDKISSPALLH